MISVLNVAVICSGLIFYYLIILLLGTDEWLGNANQIGPIIFFVACLWGGYRNIEINPLAIWTPVPWFLLACAAYYGLGPLIYHFGSAVSVNHVNAFFFVDELALLRTNLLNAAGLVLVVFFYYLGRRLLLIRKKAWFRRFNPWEVVLLVFSFIVIGFSIRIILTLYHNFSSLPLQLPGSIVYLSTLSKISILLLFVLISRGFSRYWWLLAILIIIEFVIALMAHSKMAVIEVLIVSVLGFYIIRPNIRILIAGGVSIIFLYVFILSPFVAFARHAAGTIGVESPREVTESIANYFEAELDDPSEFDYVPQGWWTRLTYSSAQAFAMYDYDENSGGETIQLMRYVLLPRLFFPDKPVMTPGRDFTAAVTGEETKTATAPGIFAEAYWNGGWLVFIMVNIYVGFLFAGLSAFSERTIAAGKFEYLPLLLIGISMGYQPTGWFVVVYVAPLLNFIAMYVVLRFVIMPLIWSLLKIMGTRAPLADQ